MSTPRRSEVDIRVSEEIKLHQDFMYELNLSLQKLKADVVELSLSCDKRIAKARSDHSYVLIAFENVQENLEKQHKNLDKKMSELCSIITKTLQKGMDDIARLDKRKSSVKDLDILKLKLNKTCDDLHHMNEVNSNYNDNSARMFNARITDEVEKLKLEIKSLEPDFEPIRKEILEHLSVLRLDFNGIVREINLIKKENTYSDKKFEDIYTQLHKLKAKK